MRALVLVEHNNNAMHLATRNTLAAAIQLGMEPVLLVVGFKCEGVANEASTIAGVSEVLLCEHACFVNPLAEDVSRLVLGIASSYDALLVSSSTFGKNIMPRVAAMLDVAQVSDVSKIIDKETFEHPIYAGNAVETVRVLDDKKVLTIRATAFDPITITQAPCSIQSFTFDGATEKSRYLTQELSQSARPELGSAKIIVSGGRGLGSKEKFVLVEELADALGAAVGASRAAVDAGFVPNEYQVGQTGRIVAPHLYIAVGISGAIQHLAGMKDSKVIVAINKDADAPIFQVATYGLVGDLFELVPELISRIKK
jgi:electron transfer flavoprotein alpha subunit